ncbi:MAG TPA: hypothetical protein VNW47_02185 [Terriglobales bacterium]|nr:hypothetical protein [Terriglobales bacterium]
MKSAYVLYHMVRADFLERVRGYSFLLTLAFSVYLGYAAYSGHVVLRLDDYRGILNSAWLGSLMALVGGTFISLVGFYIVKNSIQRDQDTRVGRILATTPMSKSFYTLAKTASNFAVLASMIFVLAIATVCMQLLRAEDPHINLWALLSPLVLLSLPCMAFTAALAVLFETLPLLRSGLGNVLYFFLWTFLLIAPGAKVMDKNQPITPAAYMADFSGVISTMGQMQAIVRSVDPQYKGGSSLNIGNEKELPTKRFLWKGLELNRAFLFGRLLWTSMAIALALIAAVFFHRFDPAREWRIKSARPLPPPAEIPVAGGFASAPEPSHTHLTPLPARAGSQSLARLIVAELRLMLKGKQWWWYVVLAGLSVACCVSPLDSARGGVLLAAWLWPILVWSSMGSREKRYATESLIFSSPGALPRQLPAVWIAGVIVSLLTAGGIGLRLLMRGDVPGAAAFLAGAAFIPSLALALGVWSGSSKAFESIYTVWWYVGPANHTPGLDFMGVSAASSQPLTYTIAAIALLSVAYWRRRTHLGYA